MIRIERTYDTAAGGEGYRILVDRLWPRGLSKDSLRVDLWAKELAPSSQLRKWFNHEPAKWDTFRNRYLAELRAKKELIQKVVELENKKGVITLLYSAKDEKYNQAVVLRDILTRRARA